MRLFQQTVRVTLVISLLASVSQFATACPMSGMSPMTGGMAGMSPMYGASLYAFPRSGMPWFDSMQVNRTYVPSGMYPMYGDPRYSAQSPQYGMPWMGSMQPLAGMFKMLPMSGGMVTAPPVMAGVQQQYPMYGMPWNLYSRQGTGEAMPVYIPRGMYPMQGYVQYLSVYPMSGMPWNEGRQGMFPMYGGMGGMSPR